MEDQSSEVCMVPPQLVDAFTMQTELIKHETLEQKSIHNHFHVPDMGQDQQEM
jgi:hypothetical protein